MSIVIRLLHIADVHIGASLSGFGSVQGDRQKQIREAFRGLPQIAEEHGAVALLVAGDLFDSPTPSREDRAMVAEVFRQLHDGGCRVFVVPGNHDPVTVKQHPYQEPPGPARVFVKAEFETEYVETEDGTLRIHGFAFDPAGCATPLETFDSVAEPGIDVALLHASLRMTDHWQEGANTLSPTEEELKALGVDYVALGDYHRPRMPEEFQAGLTACYPGSFAAVKRSETGLRGVVLVEFEGGRVGARLLPMSVPFVVEPDAIDVAGLENQAAVVQAIASQVPDGALPRVTLTGAAEFALDPEALGIALEERYGFAVVKDESRYIDSARLAELEEADTVSGHLVRVARRRIGSATDDNEKRALEDALRQALSALEVV